MPRRRAPPLSPQKDVIATPGGIPSAPAIPTTGDVWDGTTEEFTSEDLVQIGDLYYYEISNAEQLAFLAETGGDWLTYNYILTILWCISTTCT